MKLFGRSDKRFREQEPRGIRSTGGSRSQFVYYPSPMSGGFTLGRFSDDSRVGRQFFAAFGILPSQAATIPGWRPGDGDE